VFSTPGVIWPRGAGSRLDLDHFDNLLVRHELHERAVARVGLRVRAGLQTFLLSLW